MTSIVNVNNQDLNNPVMSSFRYLMPLFFLMVLSVVYDYVLSSNHNIDGSIDFQDKSLRILVVTVDHRELHEDLDNAGHTSLTAVLNYNYAVRHGYDYKYYHPVMDLNKVARKYNLTVPLQNGDIANRLRSIHPGIREFRDSAWSKLPVLWHIASAVKQYDVILYLDSDVAMTAVQSRRSIQEAIVHWDDSYKVLWGVKDLKRTGIMFLPEAPPNSNKPSVGAFVFRPKLARQIFKEWWDCSSSGTKADDHYPSDQRALWDMLAMGNDNNSINHNINGVISTHSNSLKKEDRSLTTSTVTLINEMQYPLDMTVDDWCLRTGWICHIGSKWAKDRHRLFRKMILSEEKEEKWNNVNAGNNTSISTSINTTTHVNNRGGSSLTASFRNSIRKIKANEIQFDLLGAVEAMEASGGRLSLSSSGQKTAMSKKTSGDDVPTTPPVSTTSSSFPTLTSSTEKVALKNDAEDEKKTLTAHVQGATATDKELRTYARLLQSWAEPIHRARDLISKHQGSKAEEVETLLNAFVDGKISKQKFEANMS